MPFDELLEWYERQAHRPLADSWFQWQWLMAAQLPEKGGRLRPDKFEVCAKEKKIDVMSIYHGFKILAEASKHNERLKLKQEPNGIEKD